MALPRPSEDDIHRLATVNHFSLSSEEAREYLRLFEHFLPAFDELEALKDTTPKTPLDGRSAYGKPSPEEDPLNAIIEACTVPPTGDGPLSGMTVGLKDTIAVAGVPMRCGSQLVEFVPERDATVVARLLSAGATISAMVNMDSFAFSGAGDTAYCGPTLNPHDPERLAGGSSGGSAAVLAYDDFNITLGGDQAGSIRIPASWCGVVGMKPSHGLVPYTGIVGIDQSFDHVGPLARTVRDVARMLDVLAGQDPDDPRQLAGVPTQRYEVALDRNLRGVRIGILEEGFGLPGAEAEVDDAVREALERLSEMGAELKTVGLPLHRQLGGIVWSLSAEAIAAGFLCNIQGYGWRGLYSPTMASAFGAALRARGDLLPPHGKYESMLGTLLREHHHGRFYARAQNLRPGVIAAYDALLDEVDVIAMPSTPMRAHRYETDLGIAERVISGWNMVGNTAPFCMTGHPSVSVPCAIPDGRPVGLMLTGRRFDDASILAVAAAVERQAAVTLTPFARKSKLTS